MSAGAAVEPAGLGTAVLGAEFRAVFEERAAGGSGSLTVEAEAEVISK
jgi:hypothetical protein